MRRASSGMHALVEAQQFAGVVCRQPAQLLVHDRLTRGRRLCASNCCMMLRSHWVRRGLTATRRCWCWCSACAAVHKRPNYATFMYTAATVDQAEPATAGSSSHVYNRVTTATCAQGTQLTEGSMQTRAHLQHRRREQLRKVCMVLGEQTPHDLGSPDMQHCTCGCIAACSVTTRAVLIADCSQVRTDGSPQHRQLWSCGLCCRKAELCAAQPARTWSCSGSSKGVPGRIRCITHERQPLVPNRLPVRDPSLILL